MQTPAASPMQQWYSASLKRSWRDLELISEEAAKVRMQLRSTFPLLYSAAAFFGYYVTPTDVLQCNKISVDFLVATKLAYIAHTVFALFFP